LLTDLPERLRIALLGAFAENNGPLGELVAAVLRAGHGAELLAIGLTARSVYATASSMAGELPADLKLAVIPVSSRLQSGDIGNQSRTIRHRLIERDRIVPM